MATTKLKSCKNIRYGERVAFVACDKPSKYSLEHSFVLKKGLVISNYPSTAKVWIIRDSLQNRRYFNIGKSSQKTVLKLSKLTRVLIKKNFCTKCKDRASSHQIKLEAKFVVFAPTLLLRDFQKLKAKLIKNDIKLVRKYSDKSLKIDLFVIYKSEYKDPILFSMYLKDANLRKSKLVTLEDLIKKTS